MTVKKAIPVEVKRARYALAALGVTTLAGAFTPGARALIVIVPAYTLFLALYLQRHVPRYFVSFVCWLYFLVPCVRRLIEYHAGAGTGTLILISPSLAQIAGMGTFRYRWAEIINSRLRPWIYILGAILYAMIVGYEFNSPVGMLQDAMGWLGPMFFAFYLFANRKHTRELLAGIQNSFIYGTAVMSVYGLYQYFAITPWDAAWMMNTPNLTSIGSPAPMEVRVFSTLNTPQPLSACLVFGILICLASKSRLRFYIVPLATLVLGLTESRSGYLGAVVGLLFLAYHFNTRQRIQLGFVILAVVAVLGMATQVPAVNELLSQRLQSFTSLQEDGSYNDRVASQEQAIDLFKSSPFGLGMGAAAPTDSGGGSSYGVAQADSPTLVDNGLELISLTFGWFASVIYVIGLGGAIAICFRGTKTPALFPMKAGLVALLCESPIMGVFMGVDGFLIWTSLGICTAWGWHAMKSEREAVESTPAYLDPRTREVS